MGRKGTETQFPPSSLLHAGQRGRDHGRIERIRGRLEGESSDQQVRGELALERMISRPQDKEQARHTYSRAQKAALHTPPAAPPPNSQVSHQTEAVGQTGAHQKKLNSVQRRSDGSHTVTVKKASVIKGYFDMSNDHFASVNLKPTACSGAAMSPSCGTSSFACSAHLHLHVEVFCPPYKAPEHGSVTYRGKEYRDHTGSEASGRQYLTINGHRYPLAASGDIPSCEQVKIHCDPHYELDGREGAFRDPYCLQSGEWEEGQSCVRIKCKPYRPPVNGYVFPTGEVFAGDSVAIKCDPGFMPHFGEEGAKENPACLDTRAYEPGVSCVPIMCPAYRAPQHASVTPTGPVRVGERVSIVCDSGYRARIYNDLHPTLWPTFGVETGSMPDDLVGTATPLCLETSKYEEGITCVPLPVQCPAYRAPNHGSVWYNLDEYRIASPSGLEGWPRTDSLFITCDEHYQLSDEGRQSIRCLRTGEWEQGKTCDPIMCDSFQAPPHSSFSGPRTRVLAGTQVFVSCNEGYKVADATGRKWKGGGRLAFQEASLPHRSASTRATSKFPSSASLFPRRRSLRSPGLVRRGYRMSRSPGGKPLPLLHVIGLGSSNPKRAQGDGKQFLLSPLKHFEQISQRTFASAASPSPPSPSSADKAFVAARGCQEQKLKPGSDQARRRSKGKTRVTQYTTTAPTSSIKSQGKLRECNKSRGARREQRREENFECESQSCARPFSYGS
eukprot:107001-Hanusia_phi.AAC.3